MRNFYYEGETFKNGNINIRFSPEERMDVADSERAAIYLACKKLDAFDCELISEAPECLGNFGWFLRFSRNGREYHFTRGHLDMLLAGKTAKVCPM